MLLIFVLLNQPNLHQSTVAVVTTLYKTELFPTTLSTNCIVVLYLSLVKQQGIVSVQ